MQQSISSYISFTLPIINSKVILKKLLCLADLPGAQAFSIHEPVEIVIIGKDKYIKFAAL